MPQTLGNFASVQTSVFTSKPPFTVKIEKWKRGKWCLVVGSDGSTFLSVFLLSVHLGWIQKNISLVSYLDTKILHGALSTLYHIAGLATVSVLEKIKTRALCGRFSFVKIQIANHFSSLIYLIGIIVQLTCRILDIVLFYCLRVAQQTQTSLHVLLQVEISWFSIT